MTLPVPMPVGKAFHNGGAYAKHKHWYKQLQRSKKWLVRGLVKFATAVARLVCPDLLG